MSNNNRNGDGTASYGVGEVATRFQVAVSTLHWWEKQGLLTPARHAGRRVYGDTDLRRIALIQLLQGTAMMSLPEIAALLAGGTADRDWRTAVGQRLAVCDEQLARLTSARAYLAHMLTCPSEHPVDTCPYLAEEIDAYLAITPDG
ncbi:MerR family transcriptional regulator [Streptomyces sp. WMMC500]|uniref:MerR family transcriptional regulator n=1 Tax=Streptomyces sp. WMMC500 TaxID=3015154 RepID=UPI00248C1925|nr:MerR family transcriptional regulator [Streptomyces sp. WMMC500]WBB61904.1 MerR family transcriptional regulator [Streptomyces sp. WMMC500]